MSRSVGVLPEADVVAVDDVDTLDEFEVALVGWVAHLYWNLLLVFGREGGCYVGRWLLCEGWGGVHYVLDLADLQPYVSRLVFVGVGGASELPDRDGLCVLDLVLEKRLLFELALLLLEETAVHFFQRLQLKVESICRGFQLGDRPFFFSEFQALPRQCLRERPIGFPYFHIFLVNCIELAIIGLDHLGDFSLLLLSQPLKTVNLLLIALIRMRFRQLSLEAPILLLPLLLLGIRLLDLPLVLLNDLIDGIPLLLIDRIPQANIPLYLLFLLNHLKINLPGLELIALLHEPIDVLVGLIQLRLHLGDVLIG